MDSWPPVSKGNPWGFSCFTRELIGDWVHLVLDRALPIKPDTYTQSLVFLFSTEIKHCNNIARVGETERFIVIKHSQHEHVPIFAVFSMVWSFA